MQLFSQGTGYENIPLRLQLVLPFLPSMLLDTILFCYHIFSGELLLPWVLPGILHSTPPTPDPSIFLYDVRE